MLHWLLLKAKSLTLALLTGVMLGALVKVWPWKEVVSYTEVGDKRLPVEEQLLLPWQMAGFDVMSHLIVPILLICLGAISVLLIHYISLQKRNQRNNDAL